jgi:stearoyl-CoA desaturase (delta-9 desaturase)
MPILNSSETISRVSPTDLTRHRQISWLTFLSIVGIHIAAVGAFFTFSWNALFLCLILHFIAGGIGITLGYHRLLTHRSFKVPKFLEHIIATIGTLNCQGGPISWGAIHRLHHAKSDQPGDTHSPRDGFFWSHMGWAITKSEMIDKFENYSKLMPDLVKDRYLVLLNNYHIVPTLLLSLILYFWGGLSYLCWGIFLRTVIFYHSTWLVNSAAHVWGYQTYKSNDHSRNLWWVALLTYGEGWHNNHHAFQNSARHGLNRWEIDATYGVICLLSFLGLASDIKLPLDRLRKDNRMTLASQNTFDAAI